MVNGKALKGEWTDFPFYRRSLFRREDVYQGLLFREGLLEVREVGLVGLTLTRDACLSLEGGYLALRCRGLAVKRNTGLARARRVSVYFLVNEELVRLVNVNHRVAEIFLTTRLLTMLFLIAVFLRLSPVGPRRAGPVSRSILEDDELSILTGHTLECYPRVLPSKVGDRELGVVVKVGVEEDPSTFPGILQVTGLNDVHQGERGEVLLWATVSFTYCRRHEVEGLRSNFVIGSLLLPLPELSIIRHSVYSLSGPGILCLFRFTNLKVRLGSRIRVRDAVQLITCRHVSVVVRVDGTAMIAHDRNFQGDLLKVLSRCFPVLYSDRRTRDRRSNRSAAARREWRRAP